MKFFLTVLALLITPSLWAQTFVKDYVQDDQSPDRCFPPNQVVQVVIANDNIHFGSYTSDGDTVVYADYNFQKINQGPFEDWYGTPSGQIRSKVTNTFDGQIFSHVRTFSWSFRKDTFVARFLGDRLVLEDSMNRQKALNCTLKAL